MSEKFRHDDIVALLPESKLALTEDAFWQLIEVPSVGIRDGTDKMQAASVSSRIPLASITNASIQSAKTGIQYSLAFAPIIAWAGILWLTGPSILIRCLVSALVLIWASACILAKPTNLELKTVHDSIISISLNGEGKEAFVETLRSMATKARKAEGNEDE